jgi:hypothetical protein
MASGMLRVSQVAEDFRVLGRGRFHLSCSFGHLKHKLWPKEGPGVELPV